MIYVNLYLTDRAFGGPEEGGWYFYTGEPVRSFGFFTRARAERWLPRIKKIAAARNESERRREPNSVLCDGYYEAWIEDHPAQQFPQARPHYE